MELYQRIFLWATYFIYLMYFFVYFRIWKEAPIYLDDAEYYFKLYISLLLLYFFNPFYNLRMNNFHKRVAFSAGFFLIATTSFEALLEHLKNTQKRIIDKVRV